MRSLSMIIVPTPELTLAIVTALLKGNESFRAEPSTTQAGVWHLGVTPENGQAIATEVARKWGY